MPTNTHPDYIALAMVAVLIAIVIAMVIRKWLSDRAAAKTPVASAAPEQSMPTAPGTAGQIKLNGVPPKTAAMAMAIVASKMGKPLNELRFISIQEVDE